MTDYRLDFDPHEPCRGCGFPVGDRESTLITSDGVYHRGGPVIYWDLSDPAQVAAAFDPGRRNGCRPSENERQDWDAFLAGARSHG